MDIEINRIYHNYIIKIVIFSVFLYKNLLRSKKAYEQCVISFANKRLPWKIDLEVNTGVKLDKDTERDLLLDEILNDIPSDILSTVVVKFTTPLKRTVIEIDIKNENRYSKYLHS